MVKDVRTLKVKQKGKVVGEGEYVNTDYCKPEGTPPDQLLAAATSDLSGVLGLLERAGKGVTTLAKSAVRNAIMLKLLGPDKAIESAAKRLMQAREAMGKPVTFEWALERAKLAAED